MDNDFSIQMIRPHLNNIPDYSLPSGYSIRWYKHGDEQPWYDIQKKADLYNEITSELFGQQFGSDTHLISQRQFFILNENNTPVGTSSAWFSGRTRDDSWGRVHWVAILPEYQGRGLAKPLMSITCRRLHELNHSTAYLTTSPKRPAALHLYVKFGFVPEITSEADRKIWADVKKEYNLNF